MVRLKAPGGATVAVPKEKASRLIQIGFAAVEQKPPKRRSSSSK